MPCTYQARFFPNYEKIELNQRLSGAYQFRAIAYYRKSQYDNSIADFNKAIELNPKFSPIYFWRGRTYEEMGQYDKAIFDYTKSINLNPKSATGSHYLHRGISYFYVKKYDKAWDDIHKAKSLGRIADPIFIKKLRKASGRSKWLKPGKFSWAKLGLDSEYGCSNISHKNRNYRYQL